MNFPIATLPQGEQAEIKNFFVLATAEEPDADSRVVGEVHSVQATSAHVTEKFPSVQFLDVA